MKILERWISNLSFNLLSAVLTLLFIVEIRFYCKKVYLALVKRLKVITNLETFLFVSLYYEP